MALLEIKNLRVRFNSSPKPIYAVDDISLTIESGQTLGLVGESGCGKSVTSLSVMRLVPSPAGQIESGEVLFKGQNLISYSDKEMRQIRGKEIAMIFQEPMTSLNPVFTIGNQVEEAISTHNTSWSRKQVRERAWEMLRLVGIPEPSRRAQDYPHQLSGGMRQRVMIAMALSCNPALLIADEPTTALDVTIQAQILELIKKLQGDFKTAMLLITHDLGVVAETCDDVAIMYAGKIVEKAPIKQIFENPKHPYTAGLLKSVPHFETGKRRSRLDVIPGIVPSLADLPPGCRFHDRCGFKTQECQTHQPVLQNISSQQQVACFHPVKS